MRILGADGTYVIDYVERLNNSKNANPRYWVWFTNGEAYQTQSDASINYGINNLTGRDYKGKPVTVEITRNNRIIDIKVV